MATMASICAYACSATEAGNLDWVAWDPPESQNPPTSHSVSFGNGCSISLLEEGVIVVFGTDGEKCRGSEGFATMKAKAIAYCENKAAQEQEATTTQGLDDIEAALIALQPA